jgi:F420-dependent oxidoreductase-like protein
MKFGIVANQPDVTSTLHYIERAEALGFNTTWLITGATSPDALTIFAAAGARTQHIRLGTAIVPIWPRHPLAVAGQAQAIAGIAPGRLRLGIGPGGSGNERIYGIPYGKPLGHLREYHHILKTVFSQGEVNFDGKHYKAHARIGPANQPPLTVDIPVLTSALQHGSFVLGGEIADGVLTWVCPFDYICAVGLPGMREGAQKAGRAAPPLVAHVPVAIHDNRDEVRAAVRAQFGFYPRLPYYAAMFDAAGFAHAGETGWTDAMIDATVVHGDEATVARRLGAYFDAGVGEIMAHAVAAGPDREGSLARTLSGLATLQS